MRGEHEKRSSVRIIIIQVVFVILFFVYSIRLFSMQIFSGEFYQSRARNIARQTTVIPAQRGEIFDRNYREPIVSNSEAFTVSVIPANIPVSRMQEILGRLASILGLPVEQVERLVPSSVYYLYQPVEIAANIQFDTVAALAEQADSLPGVIWQSKPVRNYHETGSLAHIVGYVGSITRDELTVLYNQGYQQGDIIGKDGIERQYDALLKGKEGQETRTVDVRGRNVAGTNASVSPEQGKNLVLTIDRDIQTLAEEALGSRIGSVVVLRPTTGEILAMVSYPWYDPNIFNQTNLGAEYQALINDPNKPFINRAIQSSYPPGSTFKIIMSTGIYAENAFSPEQTILCPGEIEYGGRTWRCHIRRPGHGRLNLHRALAQSCDIYYWTVGRDYLRIENIVNYSMEYGFGSVTGIDLPGEITGFIPTPQWKERRLHESWVGGDTMNMSIGQGWTLVTPLQMANIAAMAVNDGVIYTPHILKEVRDPRTGAVETTVAPTVLQKSSVDSGVFAAVRRDMRGVISEGTAVYPMNIRAVEIAGKTGTSEVGLEDKWHAWFTSFAPYETDNPEERVVVAVIVEAVNEWEWWAVYCSAIIYQGIFANQTYEEASRTLGIRNTQPITGYRE
jgi:penicillin-binding protein 2